MTLDELKDKLKSALNVPVYSDGGSITYPSATVDITLNAPGLHAEGKAVSRIQSVKIDLWYQKSEDLNNAQQIVLEMIEELQSTTSPDVVSIYDTQAHKYRATFDFEMI